MKKESFLLKVWNVLWPLLIYLAAQNLVVLIGMFICMIAGSLINADSSGMVNVDLLMESSMEMYEKYALLFLLIAALICIPIYYRMHKKDCSKAGEVKRNIPMTNKDYLAIILSGAALALALNNIIALTPLPYLSPGFEETSEVLSGGNIILQIVTAGIFACIVEEVSMRGVTYLRMKRYWGKRKAIFFSALVFGLYHMNLVQAVYAFFVGLFLAWLYERYDSLWAPIVAHMSANLFVILLSESSVFNGILENMVGFCLTTCISALVFYYGFRFIKQTNPLVELEFVQKEPDTLKGLTEEYKGQEKEDH